jgi:hypothetical protein
VVVPNSGGCAGLADESRPIATVRQGRTEDLHGHDAVKHLVTRPKHDPHSSMTQELEDPKRAERAQVSFMPRRTEEFEGRRLGGRFVVRSR